MATQADKIVIVSNRLPVKVDNEGNFTATTGGLASALAGLETPNSCPLLWVGWPGNDVAPENEETVRQQMRALDGRVVLHPVFLNKQEVEGYYDGYSNASLWPILHYFSPLAVFQESWFDSYQQVNRRFCDAIVPLVNANDVVWVHDYHLMLLPSMLRERIPGLKIGFFLHVPFPSYEIFRFVPHRKELIEGLLGADLLGFHTFTYVRHFKSAVLRCLGLEGSFDTIRTNGRTVRLGIHPIGINWVSFKDALSSEEYKTSLEEYARDFRERKVVLSVSRLDYTKGIPAMLDAIAYYLEHHPRPDVTFLLIAVPSRDAVQSYVELKERVVKTVGELNGKYSGISSAPPIQFIYYSVNINKLAALYSLADVALIVPLIDGMNLVAKEYIACQPTTPADGLKRPGCLILSEFTGAARELFHAKIVNPYDSRSVADAIEQALNMDPREKLAMNSVMQDRVHKLDAKYWANKFLEELQRNVTANDPCGLLPVDETVLKFRPEAPGRKVLFLDYDGTLTPIVSTPQQAVPSQSLITLLQRLSTRSDLHVIILSGRDADFLEKHLGTLNVTLVAEAGFKVRVPGEAWRLWNSVPISMAWKAQIRPYLAMYENDTLGSFVEEKNSSLVWHYRATEQELGQKRAADLAGQLAEFVNNLPIEIHHGKKIVEISSIDISKGRIVAQVLREGEYSAALCIGDDTTDENMFRVNNDKLIKVKVGDDDTNATYRLPNPDSVLAFLNKIAKP